MRGSFLLPVRPLPLDDPGVDPVAARGGPLRPPLPEPPAVPRREPLAGRAVAFRQAAPRHRNPPGQRPPVAVDARRRRGREPRPRSTNGPRDSASRAGTTPAGVALCRGAGGVTRRRSGSVVASATVRSASPRSGAAHDPRQRRLPVFHAAMREPHRCRAVTAPPRVVARGPEHPHGAAVAVRRAVGVGWGDLGQVRAVGQDPDRPRDQRRDDPRPRRHPAGLPLPPPRVADAGPVPRHEPPRGPVREQAGDPRPLVTPAGRDDDGDRGVGPPCDPAERADWGERPAAAGPRRGAADGGDAQLVSSSLSTSSD